MGEVFFYHYLIIASTMYCELTHLHSFIDMEGIIPLEEEQDFYDDCLPLNMNVNTAPMPAPIDDDIYEELPGLASSIN